MGSLGAAEYTMNDAPLPPSPAKAIAPVVPADEVAEDGNSIKELARALVRDWEAAQDGNSQPPRSRT